MTDPASPQPRGSLDKYSDRGLETSKVVRLGTRGDYFDATVPQRLLQGSNGRRGRGHALWVRPHTRLRTAQGTKDCTRRRNALDVSLLRGRMRRPYLYHWRPREERHAAGDPRRRRP